MNKSGGGYLFRKPIEGKNAKTISCKKAYVCDKNVCRKLNIRGVSKAKIEEKTIYAGVKTANVEGVGVNLKYIEKAGEDITLDKLFRI